MIQRKECAHNNGKSTYLKNGHRSFTYQWKNTRIQRDPIESCWRRRKPVFVEVKPGPRRFAEPGNTCADPQQTVESKSGQSVAEEEVEEKLTTPDATPGIERTMRYTMC